MSLLVQELLNENMGFQGFPKLIGEQSGAVRYTNTQVVNGVCVRCNAPNARVPSDVGNHPGRCEAKTDRRRSHEAMLSRALEGRNAPIGHTSEDVGLAAAYLGFGVPTL